MGRRKDINDISDEILGRILSSIVQFSPFYNPALSMGPLSPWARALRHKTEMTLVSKRWYDISIPLLYRKIVLRRAGQLHALVRTFLDSWHASHVQEITVAETCYVHPERAEVFLQNLRVLVQLCDKLNALEILPLDNLISKVADLGRLPRLTHLSLGPGINSEVKKAILEEQYVTLSSLHVSLAPHEDIGIFEFPVLEELKITIQRPRDIRMDLTFTHSWALPSIQRLIIVFSDNKIGIGYPKTILAAIRHHGHAIHYLGIHGGQFENLENILHACPNVTHLAIDYLPLSSFTNDIRGSEDAGVAQDGGEGEGEDQNLDENNVEDERAKSPNANMDMNADSDCFSLPARQQVKILDIFERGKSWPTAKPGLDNFPSVKLVRFFAEFNHDNIFLPSSTSRINPLELFKDGFSWLAPDVDLRIDRLPELLATDPSHEYSGTCAYIVHRPSQFHPSGDDWGLPSLFDDLEFPLYPRNKKYRKLSGEDWKTEDLRSDDEAPGEEWDTESSMSETSHESDDSGILRLDG